MRRKRIYFFNRFFWPDNSATAQILTDLCKGIDRRRFVITVVTSRLNYGNPSIEYPRHEDMNGIRVLRLWSTRYGRASLYGRLLDYLTIYLSIFLFLIREPETGDICVFKTDPPLLSVPGAIAKSVRGFKMISWCQDIFPEVAISTIRIPSGCGWIVRALAGARNWSLNCSERVVVLGRDMADFLQRNGIHRHKVQTISNWAVQGETADPGEQALREEWGIPEECFVVGYSGNLGRAHDWQTVLSAALCLRETSGLLFLCCGGGSGYEQLQEAATEQGLGHLFKFLPYQPLECLSSSLRVPDVHWLTLKADLSPFIFPSKFFGILQAGCPMIFIGSTSGEIAGLIEENTIGRAVSEGDTKNLVKGIEAMMADRGKTREAGKRARRLWEESFQKSVEIRKWQKMLGELSTDGEADAHE